MSGDRSIEAIFEDGVFKPLDAVRLPEHQRVCLVVTSVDDLPAALLAAGAESGQSFSFLEEVNAHRPHRP